MHSRPTRLTRTLAAGGVGAALLLNIWSVAQASSSSPEASGAASGATSGAAPVTKPVGRSGGGSANAVEGPEGAAATSGGAGAGAAGSASGQSSGPGATQLLEQGKGTFSVVSVPGDAARSTPKGTQQVRYTVEVEDGIVTDRAAFAREVVATLVDARGWQKYGVIRFVNVTPEQARAGAPVDVRISLATPKTVDAVCAPLDTMGQVSCHNKGRVAINLTRWVTGAPSYGPNLAGYREYLVNHEVGHNLGNSHATCPGKGLPAPVMMQQTKSVGDCVPNPWPKG